MKNAWPLVLALFAGWPTAASAHSGQVTFGGLSVPGAVVTIVKGDEKHVTVTDAQGEYQFADLSDGTWMIRIEMLGFVSIADEVEIPTASPSTWPLTLRTFDELAALAGPSATEAANAAPIQTASAEAASTDGALIAATPATRDPTLDADLSQRAADGLLVNGSVNNGAASPFAQLAAFGNNRRGFRSLYNGGVGIILGNSAFDARSYSFNDTQNTPKPSYSDVQFAGTFGGPISIPRLVNRLGLFALYQRTSDHTANTQPALMPTALERAGDFSATRDANGRPVQIRDPRTRLPFPGNVIPQDRISPQAAALLGYYPLPNVNDPGRYNYQRTILTGTEQDSVQVRLTQPGFGRNQMFGSLGYQRTAIDTANVFGFEDTTDVSGFDGVINWSRRITPRTTLRFRYQFNDLTSETVPYFAFRTNVSGDAQIEGNNQDPPNWGPPRLTFADGLEPLADAQFALTRTRTNAGNVEALWGRGRHNVTLGGDLRLQQVTVLSQQDPRGAFTFTGALTGLDVADFMLGIPHSSSIADGNADKYLHAPSYDAYVTDDWRFGPGFTLNTGVRWEYEAPVTERYGRLVNLDIAPGFSKVSAVTASDPSGTTTGRQYPASLINPDKLGIQPRVGVAWRPVAGSSLVIRGGYGVYRNTSVYQSLALQMAQQPPLSNTLGVENSAANPLTLAKGFIATPGETPNTFAIDPEFRVGYAENWQASLQRDLPASLTVLTTYLGTRGSRLMQQFLPNTYPPGSANPCPACTVGFVYVTSNGRSTRHAAQAQLRRRLRNGLTATLQYTLSKAMDNAAAGLNPGGSGATTGATGGLGAIAQDWLDVDAEWAPSTFDQRHLMTAQVQYTTGVGVTGGALMTGLAGSLFKGWTLTGQLTTGSGLPLTPITLVPVPGTAVTGTVRADLTGEPTEAPAGSYANPAAYAAPLPGQWGTAARNSITGPAQFLLDAGVTRTFLWGDRLNVDWRVDATNVLNRVTYSAVNTVVGSPQFGLPSRANTMRKIQTSLRFRF